MHTAKDAVVDPKYSPKAELMLFGSPLLFGMVNFGWFRMSIAKNRYTSLPHILGQSYDTVYQKEYSNIQKFSGSLCSSIL